METRGRRGRMESTPASCKTVKVDEVWIGGGMVGGWGDKISLLGTNSWI